MELLKRLFSPSSASSSKGRPKSEHPEDWSTVPALQASELVAFGDEVAFADWLARQSDLSLSGDQQPNVFQNDTYPGNQRISREFLLTEIMRPPR